MKLRQDPGDFRVQERLDVPLDPEGPFTLYRLQKQGVTTEAAVGDLARRLRLPTFQIGVGGLKDAHAEAVQHLTLPGSPKGVFSGKGWRLEPVGRVREALRPGATLGNAFGITVRDLTKPQAEAAVSRSSAVAKEGVPNYFDSQRFGGLAGGAGFVAKDWIEGRIEEGLKTLLTATYRGQNHREKVERERLAAGWGDWAALAGSLSPGEARGVAMYLRDHPGAFGNAIRCLREGTRWRTLAAYQSHLFNEALSTRLKKDLPGGVEVEIRSGSLYFPLTGALEGEAPWPLPQEKIRQARLNLPKGERAPWVVPEELKVTGPEPDTLNHGRFLIRVSFALPPGSYATVVVKRLTYDAGHSFRA